MPRRTDLESICLIGSGPIVIGQACEFDYAGCQALKVLREDGFRTIVVNSNPATIMTDPGFADRTYLEPLDLEGVADVLAASAPTRSCRRWAARPRSTSPSSCSEAGILERARHRADRRRASTRSAAPRTASSSSRRSRRAACACRPRGSSRRPTTSPGVRLPAVVRPAFTLGGHGGGFADTAEQLAAPGRARPLREPDRPGARRGVGARLGRVRARGRARPRRQRRDRLLDREPRPDGRPHRRLGHRRAADDAVRRGLPGAPRRRRSRSSARSASTPAARTSSSRATATTGEIRVIEMNPRVSRSSALASKATGYPIAKVAAKLAVGYTLDEIPNDLTGTTPASFEPTLDYVVVKIPRFAFEKFPGADTRARHADEVGRRDDGHRPHVPRGVREGEARASSRASLAWRPAGEPPSVVRARARARSQRRGAPPAHRDAASTAASTRAPARSRPRRTTSTRPGARTTRRRPPGERRASSSSAPARTASARGSSSTTAASTPCRRSARSATRP